jgi:hypothetical protein
MVVDSGRARCHPLQGAPGSSRLLPAGAQRQPESLSPRVFDLDGTSSQG